MNGWKNGGESNKHKLCFAKQQQQLLPTPLSYGILGNLQAAGKMGSGRSTLPPQSDDKEISPILRMFLVTFYQSWFTYWGDSSTKHNFVVGRMRIPVEVFISTTRILLSSPVNVMSTCPKGLCDRGASSFLNKIKSPSSRLRLSLFHLDRIERVGKYSLRCRHHIMSASVWAILHLLRLLISRSSNWPGEELGDTRPISEFFAVSAF